MLNAYSMGWIRIRNKSFRIHNTAKKFPLHFRIVKVIFTLTGAGGEVVVARGTLVTEGAAKLALTRALQRTLAHAEGHSALVDPADR